MPTETIIQPESILAELKARTAHQHERTESGVNLLSDEFSLADYRALLVRFYAFYKSYEAEMAAAIRRCPVAIDYAERQNVPRLVKDLRNLGMTDDEIARVNAADELPALDSKERVFGSLYVVEGSTLGGRVIVRHLKEKFDLDETNGAAFFSGYGEHTGKMWNEFKAAITDYAATGADRATIISAANETFEKINTALSAREVL